MEVLKIKRKGNNYQVFFDNNLDYLWCEEVIIKYQILKPKIHIDEKLLNQIIADNNYYAALKDAISYLGGMHSKKQIRKHLDKKYPKVIIDYVLLYLVENHLYDEKAFAEAYLNYCIKNGKGPIYIFHRLLDEEVDKKTIQVVLEAYSSEEEYEICEKVFIKQLTCYKKMSAKAFHQKMTNFLVNRGFNPKIIGLVLANNQRLLDNIIDEEKLLAQAYEKILRKYEKRYFGKALEERVLRSLYAKGFSIDKIKKIMESRED